MKRSVAVAFCLAVLGAGPALAQHAGHSPEHAQPYAGQQSRAISSLSDAEIEGYLAGAGMGLARAAELNGYPGPMHVLELADALALTAEQRAATEAAMKDVKAKARDLGARYVEAERAIDAAFRAGGAPDLIAARVADAGDLLAQLRLAHLEAHLRITPMLTARQREEYMRLRGYAGAHGSQHQGHAGH